MKAEDSVLFSGAANGAEAEFGAAAERHGIEEVNFTFAGHNDARRRGIRVLTHEELKQAPAQEDTRSAPQTESQTGENSAADLEAERPIDVPPSEETGGREEPGVSS